MKIDTDGPAKIAKALEDHLSPDEVARAISRGLNKAATGIRAEMIKRIGSEVNLKASRMKAVAPIQKSTPDTLESRIIVKGESIPLIEFVVNRNEINSLATHKVDGQTVRKPVQIKIMKGGPTKKLKSGFLAPTYGNIMKRQGEERGPLTMLHGPSLVSFAAKIQNGMADVSRAIVERRLIESINFQIRRAMGQL